MFGRILINKWKIIVLVFGFVMLELQILQMNQSPRSLMIPASEHNVETREEIQSLFHEDRKDSSEKDPDDDMIIFYNRVPKTGSTTFMGIIYSLCNHNAFHALHLNVTKNVHVLMLPDQLHFARNITQWKRKQPAVYHGHLAYLDFGRLGISKAPFYINIVRKPLDRLVSYYYFLRYGDNFRPNLRRSRQGNTETFDECVKNDHADCKIEKLWLQIPYFCGHAPQCWIPGNRWALDQAKRNLVEKYLVVGITEEILEFVTLLEVTLPRIFKGATKMLNTGGKSHLRKTATKKALKQSTIDHFQGSKIWKMENDFYEFAYKIFQDIKRRTLVEKDGKLVALKQQYFYEKIRPRN